MLFGSVGDNLWENIISVTIAIAIVFCVWYFVAKKKNNKKQMQRSIETCLGIYFIYLFGLIGVLAVGAYLIICKISKKHKDSQEKTSVININESQNNTTQNKSASDMEKIPDIHLYDDLIIDPSGKISKDKSKSRV